MDILKKIKNQEGKYSHLLSDESLLAKYQGADTLVQLIQNLAAKNYIKLEYEYDEDEGEDIIIKITELGQAYLDSEERKKQA